MVSSDCGLVLPDNGVLDGVQHGALCIEKWHGKVRVEALRISCHIFAQ